MAEAAEIKAAIEAISAVFVPLVVILCIVCGSKMK